MMANELESLPIIITTEKRGVRRPKTVCQQWVDAIADEAADGTTTRAKPRYLATYHS
jgi:hypothetical protein